MLNDEVEVGELGGDYMWNECGGEGGGDSGSFTRWRWNDITR